MPKIVFINPDGSSKDADAAVGTSVMEAAVAHNIPQVEAECGGSMACATCHVYVDAAWSGKVAARTEFEADMLEMAEDDVLPGSRLSCQINMTPDLDGLVIRLPR